MENEFLIKCAAIGLLIIGVAYVAKRIFDYWGDVKPVNMMDEDFKKVLEKIQTAETYKAVMDLESDIDQFDLKYNGYENCGRYVEILYSLRQNKKQEARNAIKNKNNGLQVAG